MSGIFSSTINRDYFFVALGLVAALWFFFQYSDQDPRSVATVSMEENEVELRAAEVLHNLGYSPGDYRTRVLFRSNSRLLDTLQHQMGRPETIKELREEKPPNIKPYFWEVRFTRSSSAADNPAGDESVNGQQAVDDSVNELMVRLDQEGNFVELLNPGEWMPIQRVDREALIAAFGREMDTLTGMISSMADTTVARSFFIRAEQPGTSLSEGEGNPASRLQNGRTVRLTTNHLFRLANFHLQQTGWDLSELERDTVFIDRYNNLNAATVRFSFADPGMGQMMYLNAKVSPSAALLGLSVQYQANQPGTNNWINSLWEILRSVVILFFGFGAIVIFFFRIRSRAIDTRSALVVSIIMGLSVSTVTLLREMSDLTLMGGSSTPLDSVLIFVQTGIMGALSSLGFFMLFAISDSITRQHWSKKLAIYDYLRQGMIFNKPLGLMTIRSVILSVILAGFWTLLLWLFPHAYMEVGAQTGGSASPIFIQHEAGWPPVFMLFNNAVFSLAMVLSVFMVVGSQTYAQTKNKWIAGLLTVIGTGIVVPVWVELEPAFTQFIIASLFGFALALIYHRWEFLTVALSFFLFLGWITTATGWIVTDSPDMYIFVCFLFLVVFLVGGGTLAVTRGKEERVLPRYVPDYVEELAQEERIKQELAIAREVQQSFLPARTPQLENLDLAAICQPAYETGGDYYDFIQLDDHRIALAIGDVSGKGIQAAFYMTFTKGLLHSLCRETDSPAELLIKANRLFCDNARKGTFISLVYGIIDLEKKTFTFARAGHNPVIRMNRATGEAEALQPGGLGLGLTREAPFDQNIREIKLDITPNDLFVLYTDGVVEALNETHQFYGDDRLVEILKKEKDKSSKEIINVLSKDVVHFAGDSKQHDDMTIVVIKFDK